MARIARGGLASGDNDGMEDPRFKAEVERLEQERHVPDATLAAKDPLLMGALQRRGALIKSVYAHEQFFDSDPHETISEKEKQAKVPSPIHVAKLCGG